MLKVITTLWKKGKINNVVIFAPKTVLSVWKKEIHDSVLIPVKFTEDVINPQVDDECLIICLKNYESLRSFKKTKKFKSYDLAVCDESHRIKNRNSISSKVTYKLTRESKYRYCLSGTPMGNEELDFYSQYKFLGDIFGKYTEFDRTYFKKTGYMGYKRKFKSESRKRLFYEIINRYSFRITKDECLDLPGVTETVVPVNLQCMKAYEKLKKELLLEYEDEFKNRVTIEAPLAITLVTKLQQLCCGFIYDSDHNAIPQGDDSKIEVLKDLLNDHSNEKIVIFCKYDWEINRIEEELSKHHRVLVYNGKTKDKEIWTKFKTDYDVMIAQIKSGGTGLNLQCASTVVFYSLPYSYIDVSQAKDRVYRNGQSNKVSIYYLLGKNTIEENIYRIICQKLSGAVAILDDFRKTTFFH